MSRAAALLVASLGVAGCEPSSELLFHIDDNLRSAFEHEIPALSGQVGGYDRAKLGEYLGAIREVERRIATLESSDGDFEVPDRPVGVPETFKASAELTCDLQVLVFQAGITRVTSFLMARENINRSYTEIGRPEVHLSMSYHGNNPDMMKDFSTLNTCHVETLVYDLHRLESIPDGDGTLLDHTVILNGSGMSDGTMHNNDNVPVVVIGGQENRLTGNRHLVNPQGTALANLSLSLWEKCGVNMEAFGDSTDHLSLLSSV